MSILDHTDPQSGEDTVLPVSFPAHFLWGAATAAYQVEGGLYARAGARRRSGTSSRPHPVKFFRVIPARWRSINTIVIPLISR